MHRRAVMVWVILMFTTPLWAQELPKAIASYYEDWNFVARSTTWHQREVLWSAYRRNKTVTISGSEQEILIKMNNILEATESSNFTMPMLLAGTEPPVTSELLVPFRHTADEKGEIVVRLKVMQSPVGETEKARGTAKGTSRAPKSVSMCQYTDRWIFRDGRWKVVRSPFVWVESH